MQALCISLLKIILAHIVVFIIISRCIGEEKPALNMIIYDIHKFFFKRVKIKVRK
jgi:hypothetical protein